MKEEVGPILASDVIAAQAEMIAKLEAENSALRKSRDLAQKEALQDLRAEIDFFFSERL